MQVFDAIVIVLIVDVKHNVFELLVHDYIKILDFYDVFVEDGENDVPFPFGDLSQCF